MKIKNNDLHMDNMNKEFNDMVLITKSLEDTIINLKKITEQDKIQIKNLINNKDS